MRSGHPVEGALMLSLESQRVFQKLLLFLSSDCPRNGEKVERFTDLYREKIAGLNEGKDSVIVNFSNILNIVSYT